MKKIILLAAVLFFSIAGAAQNLPQLPNDPAVKVGKLDNGLTYYIRKNAIPEKRAEFYLATRVGSIQETPAQDGLAHFLEHMCFNGTKNFPGKGIINYLESIGASFGGNVNAGTGQETTVYLLTNIPLINENVVDSCILILHDYSHFVTCDPEEIDKERGVIVEEKRTRNTAGWRIFMETQKCLLKGTPFETNTLIGSEEQLKTFAHHELTDFYHTWYRPDNQAVIVVGDINVDEVEAKIKSTFADIPAPVNPKAKDVIRFVPFDGIRVGIITDAEATSSEITVVWESDPRPDAYNSTPIGLMQETIEDIIGSIMDERFEAITSKPDAPFLSASFGSGAYNNAMDVVLANARFKDGEYDKAFEALMTEVAKLKKFGITDAEFERAKARIVAQYESAAKKADTRKSNELVQPLINNFMKNKAYMEPKTAEQVINALFQQINAQTVNQIMGQAFSDKNCVILYNGPKKEGLVDPTEQGLKDIVAKVNAMEIKPDVVEDIPTAFLDPAKLKGSKVAGVKPYGLGSEILTLKNGINVILYPTDIEKDKISLKLIKKGGQSLVSDEDLYSVDETLFRMYASNSGVAQFSNSITSKMLAGKKVSAAPFISSYTHGISASSTKKDIETAFQLMYLMYTQPRFDADEYNKGIKQIEAILPNYMAQSDYKLQEAVMKNLFCSPRKYIVTPELLAKANVKTAESVYKRLFNGTAGVTVIIAGDFQKEEMVPMVEKYLGSIKKGGKATDWKYLGEGIVDGQKVVDFRAKMEAPKATCLQVWKANKGYTPEAEVAYSALDYILQIVYTNTLREDEGGTYGASTSGFVRREPNSMRGLQVAFETNEEQSSRLRELAIKGIKDIAENGPSAEDFDKAVKNLQKRIPEKKLKVGFWMASLEEIVKYGGDPVAEEQAAVDALTPEKVKEAAAELINSGNFIEIVMKPEK